ncbi:MAG TPA: hypothetical protein DDY98_04140 [Ruminococcaceae bacterium]|nr:hypothetical protein [Oscillospiraceae bacterium]
MNYTINPQSAFGLSFSVPVSVTDKHLKLAGSAQLKVLLWLLRHTAEQPTTEQMCRALNMTPADANDAMQYWLEVGLVMEQGETVCAVQTPQTPTAPITDSEPTAPAADAKTPIAQTRPTAEQVSRRGNESSEIAFLFNEAQKKFGRTIGYDSQSTLLMIHDSYGLPVEVILMLIEYCVSIGKSGMSYISTTAKNWSEKEIDSIEKADEKIKSLRRCESLWKELCELTGISTPRPTAVQSEYLHKWSKDFGYPMNIIFAAYEEMANHTDKISFAYMNKVLENWHQAGVREIGDIDRIKQEKAAAKTKPNKQVNTQTPSYDLNAFMQHSAQDPIVYKKNKKGAQ